MADDGGRWREKMAEMAEDGGRWQKMAESGGRWRKAFHKNQKHSKKNYSLKMK